MSQTVIQTLIGFGPTWIDVGGMGEVAHAQLYRGAPLLLKGAVVRPVCAGPAVPVSLRERPFPRRLPIEAQAARLQIPAVGCWSHDVTYLQLAPTC